MVSMAPEATTEDRTQGTVAATVTSVVVRVADVDRSVDFYCDVFSCRVAIREPGAALLLTPNGFQIYLYKKDLPRRSAGVSGVQYLMWATDSQDELQKIAQRLRKHDPAAYTHAEGELTFVEGCDPDEERVIVVYPSPSQLPRQLIASRFQW